MQISWNLVGIWDFSQTLRKKKRKIPLKPTRLFRVWILESARWENSAFDQQNSIFKNTVFPGKYRFSGILGVLVCRVKKYSVPCLHICEKHRTNTSKTRQNIQFLALILGNLSMAKKCVPHFFFTSSFFFAERSMNTYLYKPNIIQM